jgi:hypothetical protein
MIEQPDKEIQDRKRIITLLFVQHFASIASSLFVPSKTAPGRTSRGVVDTANSAQCIEPDAERRDG